MQSRVLCCWLGATHPTHMQHVASPTYTTFNPYPHHPSHPATPYLIQTTFSTRVILTYHRLQHTDSTPIYPYSDLPHAHTPPPHPIPSHPIQPQTYLPMVSFSERGAAITLRSCLFRTALKNSCGMGEEQSTKIHHCSVSFASTAHTATRTLDGNDADDR